MKITFVCWCARSLVHQPQKQQMHDCTRASRHVFVSERMALESLGEKLAQRYTRKKDNVLPIDGTSFSTPPFLQRESVGSATGLDKKARARLWIEQFGGIYV